MDATPPSQATPPTSPPPGPPRLLDQRCQTLRQPEHAEPTAATFADWGRACIHFQGKRHPRDRGEAENGQFLLGLVQTKTDPTGLAYPLDHAEPR